MNDELHRNMALVHTRKMFLERWGIKFSFKKLQSVLRQIESGAPSIAGTNGSRIFLVLVDNKMVGVVYNRVEAVMYTVLPKSDLRYQALVRKEEEKHATKGHILREEHL